MGEKANSITVLGAGYVGLTTAAILANCGYKVYLIEPDSKRLDVIKKGKSFFFEQGIDPLVEKAVQEKTLIPTDSYEQAVPHSGFIFSCVGTPDNPDGSSNLSYVFSAAETAAGLMKPGTIYIQKSTVPVGTGRRVIDVISKRQKDFHYVSNPEFLRESTALYDTLYFDRVVVGGDDHQANQQVLDIYVNVESFRDKLTKLAGVEKGHTNGAYVETNLNGAELVKVTANAFLALKISFANNIAKLADQAGADVNEIMDAVGSDRRIGRAFLNASRGYGGGCFPKDVSGLISSAEEHGVDMPIMAAATDVNQSMAGYIANKAKDILGTLEGKRVAVLGLSFKAGTSDARRSPGVKLANILDKNGARVLAYDPEANGEAREELRNGVEVVGSVDAATKRADAVFIATDWKEFLDHDLGTLAKRMAGTLFVDAMNAYTIEDVEKVGLTYTGVGRNGKKT
jgi:UDPglucose 6-dehydrogenase